MKFFEKSKKYLLMASLFLVLFSFVNIVSAQQHIGDGQVLPPEPEAVNTLKNPLEGVAGTIPELIQKLLEIVVTIGIPIIVVMIIYTGFRFVKAQGNPEEIKTAKQALMWVIIGAGIILGAWVLANALAGTVDAIKSAANQS